jgi:hypothetical protein
MDHDNEGDKVAKDSGSIKVPTESYIPTSPYSRIKREISETDLQSPAVQRILLGEVDKLQYRVVNLERIEEQFHAVDKKCGVLEEKIKALTSQEVLYGFCLTVGAAIVGLSSLVWKDGYGWVAISIGSSLIIGAVLSKAIKWR